MLPIGHFIAPNGLAEGRAAFFASHSSCHIINKYVVVVSEPLAVLFPKFLKCCFLASSFIY